MLCVRKFALKTGFVFVLNVVLPDVVARSHIEGSNYQREITDFFFCLGYWCIFTERLHPYRSRHNVKWCSEKMPFCLKELSNVGCGLLINLSERCYNSWF